MSERVNAAENEPVPTLAALLLFSLPVTFAPFLSRYLHHHFGFGGSVAVMTLYGCAGSLFALSVYRALWRGRRLESPSTGRVALAILLMIVIPTAADFFCTWVDHHLY
jgi:hypothetical protein